VEKNWKVLKEWYAAIAAVVKVNDVFNFF